ncbi:MAG: sensor histidine kinase, partial [Nitrospirota bacterium]
GRTIRIITRAEGEKIEHVVDFDFSKYDDEFLSEEGKEKDLFLDDISIPLITRVPAAIKEKKIRIGTKLIDREPKGTLIEISNLKGSWTKEKIRNVYEDVTKLESIFEEKRKHNKDERHIRAKNSKNANNSLPFDVYVYKDKIHQSLKEEYLKELWRLLDDQSVLKVEGSYDEQKSVFKFDLNGQSKVLPLSDPDIVGLTVFNKRFGRGGEKLDKRPSKKTECGSFHFGFYIFDFRPQAPAKYRLDKKDKDIIREHRIYLYRDGIRVYPYGEPDDDWLQIDMYRGTIAAGHFLSNEQVVGYVKITQGQNPNLKDKTSREGLITEGNATEDFIVLVQTLLRYIRRKPFAQYLISHKSQTAHEIFRTQEIQQNIEKLKKIVGGSKKIADLIAVTEKAYRIEREFLIQRAETTEELAGVGLSVETSSHDIMAVMGKAMGTLDGLIRESLRGGEWDDDVLQEELQSLRGMLSFVEAQLKDIQLLFKSSKQRRRLIRIHEILEKIERIYRRILKDNHIKFSIRKTGSPLVAKTTDAVIMQLLINLFDNAIYWLQTVAKPEKEIQVWLDGNNSRLIFSDNGPGVKKDDEAYIFEAFYSGKGQEGRGLGLYIARQLLEKHDYAIDLAELKSERILSGANFVASFVSEEK